MSVLPWVKVASDLLDHPKTGALAHRLGDPRAAFYPLALWLHVARYYPEGSLPDAEDAIRALEVSARWTCEPGALVAALVAVRFLDRRKGRLVVHDWTEWSGAYVAKLDRDRAWQRTKRAEERKKRRSDVAPTSADVVSKKEKEKENRPEAEEAEALRLTPPPDAPRPSAKDERKANARHAPLRAMLSAIFFEVKGAKYLWQGAKDAEALNALLPLGTDVEIEQRWRLGLDGTGFLACATVAQLRQKWNDLAPKRTLSPSSKGGTRLPPPGCEEWGRVRAAIQGQVRDDVFSKTFAPLVGQMLGDALALTAPDRYAATFLRDVHLGFLMRMASEALGGTVEVQIEGGGAP